MSDSNTSKPIEIHKLIKKLRKSRGLTQIALAEQLGYSNRQIMRIESGEADISKEAIELLSKAFNVDIHQYLSISDKFKTFECYEEYIQLRKEVENADLDNIKASYNRLKDNPNFKDGEKLQLILYCNSLILSFCDNEYIKSNEICLKALDVFGYRDYMSFLETNILTEMSYPVLFQMSYNYLNIGEFDRSYRLSTQLYKHFKNLVFENSLPLKNDMYHMKKYYIAATNNLAHLYYELKNYEKALELTNEAVNLSNQFGVNIFTHYVMHTKFQIYYAMGDIENAKKFYNIFEYSCEIHGKNAYYNGVLEHIKSKYHLIFE